MKHVSSAAHCFKILVRRYKKHIVKNALLGASTLAIGDCFAQKMEQYVAAKYGSTQERARWDYTRTGTMFIVGAIVGRFQHYYYIGLDKFIPGHGAKAVVKKIALDQLVTFLQAPMFYIVFFFGAGWMEGNTIHDGIEELKDKFLTVFLADCCFWTAAQFINFYYLSTRFRVFYVSVVSLCWGTFLSYMKHMVKLNNA